MRCKPRLAKASLVMAIYTVKIPEYWHSYETVEASSEKEAIRKVYDGEGDKDGSRPSEYASVIEPEDAAWRAWENI